MTSQRDCDVIADYSHRIIPNARRLSSLWTDHRSQSARTVVRVVRISIRHTIVPWEDMTEAQKMKLRQTRKTSQTRGGQLLLKVEPISAFTCDGSRTKPCGEFVYTLACRSTRAAPRRPRSDGAATSRVPCSTHYHSVALTIHCYGREGAPYCTLVLSVMCFNAEVWPIANFDATYLEGVHFRLLRAW